MLTLLLALNATVANLPADFDGTIKDTYTIDEKLKILEWRTDYLLKQNVALEATILEMINNQLQVSEETKTHQSHHVSNL